MYHGLDLFPTEIWSQILVEVIDATNYYSQFFFPNCISSTIIAAKGKPFFVSKWKLLRLVCKTFYEWMNNDLVVRHLHLSYFVNPEIYLGHGFRSWLEKGAVNLSRSGGQPAMISKTITTFQTKIRMLKTLEDIPKTKCSNTIFSHVRSLLISKKKGKLLKDVERKTTTLTNQKRKRDELIEKLVKKEQKLFELQEILFQMEYPPRFA